MSFTSGNVNQPLFINRMLFVAEKKQNKKKHKENKNNNNLTVEISKFEIGNFLLRCPLAGICNESKELSQLLKHLMYTCFP